MRIVAVLAMLAVAPMTLSCYGRFPLTKAVYRFNGQVGESVGDDATKQNILQSVVMWVFIIIPVYKVAMLADAIIFNLIEFWTGETIQIGDATLPDGSRVVVAPDEGGHTATLTVMKDGRTLAQQRLVKVSDQLLEVRQTDGTLAGTAERSPDGAMIFKDAHGRTISTVPSEAFAAGVGL
jgi:hypothetical protein